MKKIILSFSFLLCLSMAFAQLDVAQKYASVITANSLYKHLSIIASAEMEGRETGTAGERRAAAYIESQFKEMGLQSVPSLKGYQQYFPLYQDSLTSASLMFNAVNAEYGKDFIAPLNSNENGKFTSKKLIFAGYGIDDVKYNDYTGLDVKGKLVIVFLGEPKKDGKYFLSGSTRSSAWTFPGIAKKMAAAKARGAIGLLVINPTQESFNQRSVDNGKKTGVYYPRENESKNPINVIQLSHEYAKNLLGTNFDTLVKICKSYDLIDKQWTMEVKAKLVFKFEKYRNVIKSSNVVGIVEGSDKKNEYVFVTGHYDHLGVRNGQIFYGADDDGSGTCAVIQMAEAFTKAANEGFRPRRTIVFMTVSGEEKGL